MAGSSVHRSRKHAVGGNRRGYRATNSPAWQLYLATPKGNVARSLRTLEALLAGSAADGQLLLGWRRC